MTKEEYNKNRPKIKCPICGKEFTKANYQRHYNACNNPDSKLNIKKQQYTVAHDKLNCVFCNKLLKNRNALTQHELRCKDNPNRKSYNSFSDYIKTQRKGKNKYNCKKKKKQVKTVEEKYKNVYTSPVKGIKRNVTYLYENHNNTEIEKWRDYVKTLNVDIPKYEIFSHNKDNTGYNVIRKSQIIENNTVKLSFEHNYIMNLYLHGELEEYNTVHHIDMNPKNNDITNLIAFETNGEHKRFHNSKYAWLIYNEDTHKFNCILKKDNTVQ